MKNYVAILAVCAALTGCSATGEPYSARSIPSIPKTSAQLVIYRPSGFIGSAINWHVKVNGKDTCKLPQGSYFVTKADAGKTQIQIEQLIYTFNAKAGERDYIEISVRNGTVLAGGFGLAGIAIADAATNNVYSNFNISRRYESDALNGLVVLKKSTDCK